MDNCSSEPVELSVVIPTWSGTSGLVEMALNLAAQVKPMCDELIITEDGQYSEDLKRIAHTYLLHPRLKHGLNLALGLSMATMEFVALMDSDIVIDEGALKDLCVPGRIVSPGLKGWFIVGPRLMLSEFPPFENLHYIDGIDSWWSELQSKFQVMSSDRVAYRHSANQTASALNKWKRLQEIEEEKLHPKKEIDPRRHAARLLEDSRYKEQWQH